MLGRRESVADKLLTLVMAHSPARMDPSVDVAAPLDHGAQSESHQRNELMSRGRISLGLRPRFKHLSSAAALLLLFTYLGSCR